MTIDSSLQPLQVKLLDPRFGDEWPLPAYATEHSAGLDLRAALETELTLQPGDRIAQLVVLPIARVALQVVDTFTDSVRGTGGFGHTGVR